MIVSLPSIPRATWLALALVVGAAVYPRTPKEKFVATHWKSSHTLHSEEVCLGVACVEVKNGR